MHFVFFRQVIPLPSAGKDMRKVRANISGIINGKRVEVGSLEFPDTQSWTKFYGAISKGGLAISDFDVTMENVEFDGVELPPEGPFKSVKSTIPPPPKKES